MEIRTMTTDDYESVYALWCACDGMGLNDTDDSPAGIARFLARNPETCFVAVEQSAVLGVILAGNDGRRGYIHHMAVYPAHRRQGIGRALLEAALAALRRCGIVKTALVVFRDNTDGNGFWERAGFFVRDDLNYRNRQIGEMHAFRIGKDKP